jgi:transglutaminase-like putative cysteine protease
MEIRLGYELSFEVPRPTPMQLMLYVHPEQASQLRRPERIEIEPATVVEDFVDEFGNRAARILAPAGTLRIRYDNVIDVSGRAEVPITGARLTPVRAMPPECWRFLLASRYCEVDRLSAVAGDLFGATPESWERVQAVVDWVHTNVAFGYQFARPTKSAADVYLERQGVCRDFQHLAIAFLRALNVPARYATGFLGDIGVPPSPSPMDFSAWSEVYLATAPGARSTAPAQPARIGRISSIGAAGPRRRRRRPHDLPSVATTLKGSTVWTRNEVSAAAA